MDARESSSFQGPEIVASSSVGATGTVVDDVIGMVVVVVDVVVDVVVVDVVVDVVVVEVVVDVDESSVGAVVHVPVPSRSDPAGMSAHSGTVVAVGNGERSASAGRPDAPSTANASTISVTALAAAILATTGNLNDLTSPTAKLAGARQRTCARVPVPADTDLWAAAANV